MDFGQIDLDGFQLPDATPVGRGTLTKIRIAGLRLASAQGLTATV
jgi:hypothetical protein